MRNIGLVVVILGILMTLFTGINLVTKEKVLDMGSVEISKEEETPVYWSPIAGLVLIGVGSLLIGINRKK
ncbi:MAG: hypothetical protein JNL53_08065 [Cyclobacteriaceae bacterium]|nr:hypothetical protein [Cyclobacteriaceae bacterium]